MFEILNTLCTFGKCWDSTIFGSVFEVLTGQIVAK